MAGGKDLQKTPHTQSEMGYYQTMSPVPEISPGELRANRDRYWLLDVREPSERAQASISPSQHIPLAELSQRKAEIPQEKPLVIYCASGIRSAQAAESLERKALNLAGGIERWISEGGEISSRSSLSGDDLARYSRQILLEEIGIGGQERIASSRVFVLGAGGLGSPALAYLAAAGVGKIGIADGDRVERSNLQRQIIHNEKTIGMNKALSAEQFIRSLNPGIETVVYEDFLDRNNLEVLSGYDLLLDGSDNFATRYLLNEVTQRLSIPYISASILAFSGQISTFMPGGPCYRCLYPEPPPPELAPRCSEAGVLGTSAGIFGVMQAEEALRIITGFGTNLGSRMLLRDGLDNSWRELPVYRDPDCPVCARAGKGWDGIEDLPDTELLCQIS